MTSMEEPAGSVAPDADLSAELARVRVEREALAGVAVLTGAMWARVVGIYLAGLSAILNIVFLAGYPFWSLVITTLDVLIIYALAIYRRELKPSTGWKEQNHAVSTAGRVLDHAVFLLVDPVDLLGVQDHLRHLPQPRPERLG